MRPANIHHSTDLFEKADSTFEEQAVIQPFGCRVYLISRPTDQSELDHYAFLLNSRIRNQWISRAHDGNFKIVEAGSELRYPKICVNPSLAGLPGGRVIRKSSETPFAAVKEDVTFVLIIEGKNASREAKVVTKNDRQDAANVMMYEALNGYSTVFLGAIMRRNINKVFGDRGFRVWNFKQVESAGEALAIESRKQGDLTIGVIC